MSIGDMNLFMQIGDIWFSWQFSIKWSELNPIIYIVIIVVFAIIVFAIIDIAIIVFAIIYIAIDIGIINNCIVR